ncbi:uncharacterized protein LOC109503586 [Harpegnathos saltator]|uniref:uncharacterized protein LOC109503586 n=1 Tax=Harpegnathos saltator TaxID=610380 RepID=UPI0009490DA8|nr:uncharacterized protein LOC109503586 [Harpegnathos saltator]
MPKVKERDEQEALKLDEHYKRTLMNIRPYISNLKSLEEAHLCKIWFDKLNATISQRNLRNEYLLELSRQLKAGTLEGIFKTQPPDDLLMPLSSRHAVCISSSLSSELSDHNRNCYNYLMLNRKLSQRNYPKNGMRFYASDSTTYATSPAYYHNGNTIERNHLKLCKHRIDMLTVALENFQIQNEQLKQELKKYRGNTVSNEVFQLRNHIEQLTDQEQSRNLMWKVRSLKKTISKLRKLNKTIENVYEKKLQRVVKVPNNIFL